MTEYEKIDARLDKAISDVADELARLREDNRNLKRMIDSQYATIEKQARLIQLQAAQIEQDAKLP